MKTTFRSVVLILVATVIGRCGSLLADPPAAPTARRPIVLSEEALKIHREAILVDGHNDLPWAMRTKAQSSLDKYDISTLQTIFDTDIPRLRKGGMGLQFWSAYVPADTARTGNAAHQTLEQIDLIHRLIARYSDTFEMASTVADVERIHNAGKIACFIGIEGGHSIENSLSLLRIYYQLGARYMTLTHSDTLEWADSATDTARHGGLAPFGIEVVREMNRLGMLVDISHVSAETMRTAIRVTKAPVIASHSSAFAVAQHPRNVPDDVLELLPRNGGVVMVNFFSGFIEPEGAKAMLDMFAARRELRRKITNDAELEKAVKEWHAQHPIPRGTVHTIVDHIQHIAKVAGVDHVGLGSDFDGVTMLPEQMEDVSCYPYITQELLNRGFSAADIHKILGGNVLRAMRQAEDVAAHWTE